MGFAADVAVGGEAGGHARPAAAADEFGVHGAERDQAAPPMRAAAVEAFHFQKALLAVVDDACAAGTDASFAEQRKRVVFGQQ